MLFTTWSVALAILSPVTAQIFRRAAENATTPIVPAISIFGDRPDNCPPCFNCNLDDFKCHQFANCTKSSGRCACPSGFGGEDCSVPLCGSLADGNNRLPRGQEKECQCKDGWGGVNCNVCQRDDVCNALLPNNLPDKEGGVCYTEGLVVKQHYQMCDVTNAKIVEMLKDQKPQVTFSCNAEDKDCNFQFWVDQQQSFYCALDECDWDVESTATTNTTSYRCEHLRCRCIPGRMLCGKDGSIDLGDLLEQQIVGPGTFKTVVEEGKGKKSFFEEPNMNEVISNIFGDKSIFLSCSSGECLYKTDVPGYEKPINKINTPLVAGVIAGVGLFVVAFILIIFFLSRRNARKHDYMALGLDEDDHNAKIMADHKPASLYFENVSYGLKDKQILHDISGVVHPGQLMAIMGASGAGKTTFLDILARKNKVGATSGNFYINGKVISDSTFRSVIGFVDQDDTLLPTLTVHETIMDSALLRLPRDMSHAAKQQKVEDIEKQLGIWHIRDSLIGSEEIGGRGISGGEKRRVGIACELVTSPSILFLDEPTSGLDAYNAFNVIECLVNLVKTYNRTVIFTIHQPRSNIVALFDRLVLLAKGKTVYSGPFSKCQAYFDGIGYSCPPGFNIADYLVDLTMHVSDGEYFDDLNESLEPGQNTRASSAIAVKSVPSITTSDLDAAPPSPAIQARPVNARQTSAVRRSQEQQLFTRRKSYEPDTPPTTASSSNGGSTEGGKPKSRKLDGKETTELLPSGTNLDFLVSSFRESDVAKSLDEDIAKAVSGTSRSDASIHSLGDVVKGYKKASLSTQFYILSRRIWRNLYRNPMLMLTHYAIAILLAVLIGFLFYGLTADIPGFQNRLGLFFFLLALCGFSTLSSLTVFAPERLVFVRERAKGYYAPISYYSSKVIFDIVPLRLIPPLIMGSIVYPMTGLRPTGPEFGKFLTFIVLFNLAAATVCLFIGIMVRNAGVANLVGVLFMLFSLLLSGFLLNHNTIPKGVLWVQKLSIFHYSFEGLIVNEVTPLTLIDHKYGLDIEVPGAAILSSFGFDNLALWDDVLGLVVYCGVFLVLGYVAMHFVLVERR